MGFIGFHFWCSGYRVFRVQVWTLLLGELKITEIEHNLGPIEWLLAYKCSSVPKSAIFYRNFVKILKFLISMSTIEGFRVPAGLKFGFGFDRVCIF